MLYQITATHKDSSTENGFYPKALLLNSEKTVLYNTNSSGTTDLLYYGRESRRISAHTFTTATSKVALRALMRESLAEPFINLDLSHIWRNGRWEAYDKYTVVSVKLIYWAYDLDTASSVIVIEHGPFKSQKYKTSHTIAEIETAASASVSLSES